MSINELRDYGITMQGGVLIQYWENDEPTILFDGDFDYVDYNAEYTNKDIIYMFPFSNGVYSAICIELEWDE